MKLAVGYPWASPFMFSAAAENMVNLRRPCDTRFFRGMGWSPARRHLDICEKALGWGADLICIIGSDQVHPEDMLERLVARFKSGYEVVGALVPCRGYFDHQEMKPFQPMAWRFKKSNKVEPIRQWRGMQIDPDMMELIDPKDGDMQRVNFMGSGVIMFHRDHLTALKKPWFYETVNHEDQVRTACMDTKFCWRLQNEAFAKVWVDTTIKVEHLHVFNIDDTFQDRFADWSEGEGDKNICSYRRTA